MHEPANATDGSNDNQSESTAPGGDYAEEIECPFCGESVANTAWPPHVRSDACDGGDLP